MLATVALVGALAAPSTAAVTLSVGFNSLSNFAGITAWPSAPTVDITSKAPSPGAYITVPDGNLGNAVDGFSFGQSFTATTSGKLTKIQLPVTGSAPRSFTLSIYDGLALDWTDISAFDWNMDTDPDPYRPGIDVSNNLLADDSVLTWNQYTQEGATAAVLDFALTGADQIDIVEGKTYIVEFLLSEDPSGQFLIGRNGRNNDSSTNYEGGQAFHHREPFNGNALRDIAMAFTIVPSTPFLGGDFDEVGGVTAADLALWRAGFGTATGAIHMQGDADADGDVDGNDFVIWQRQLGQGAAVGAASAVPEPAGVAILMAACGAAAARRRRR